MMVKAQAAVLVLGMALATAAQDLGLEKDPNVLAQSDFLWDSDGWTLQGNALGITHGARMIKAADNDDSVWYFVAPDKFVGAKRAAYRGTLSFRFGFFEYNSEGQDFMDKEYDIVLESEAYGITVGLKYVVPAWSFRSDHEIELDEATGWSLKDGGGPPSRPDMIRLLSKLSAIKIRGGYYKGHEDSYIMSVKLMAGPQDSVPTPTKTSLKEQRIHSAEGVKPDEGVPPPPEDDVPPPPETEDDHPGLHGEF